MLQLISLILKVHQSKRSFHFSIPVAIAVPLAELKAKVAIRRMKCCAKSVSKKIPSFVMVLERRQDPFDFFRMRRKIPI